MEQIEQPIRAAVMQAVQAQQASVEQPVHSVLLDKQAGLDHRELQVQLDHQVLLVPQGPLDRTGQMASVDFLEHRAVQATLEL